MSKSKKSASKPKIDRKGLTSQIVNHLSKNPGKNFTLKQFFRNLKLNTHPLKMLAVDVLNKLLETNFITRNEDGEFFLKAQPKTVEGEFIHKHSGKNYVTTKDGQEVRIYDEDSLHALNGDIVRVSLLAKKKGSCKLRGQVTEIIKRNEKPIIGTLQITKKVAMLTRPDGTLAQDILIPNDKLKGGRDGDKAIVKITDWPERAKNPIGEVVEILGKSGENNTEMHAILAEFGLPYSYPKEVEDEANKISGEITAEEIAKREDFRNVTTFTIDPKDAKDFDDALSIRKIGNGVWEVGVHIADVSHYVTENSIIDKEAVKRATSIYLVDRTIPMLPERLCNFVCSLRPDEEKLTYSVIFEMDENATIRKYHIAHTVIKSNRRFAYEEVQAILEENGEADDIPNRTPVPENMRKGEYCNELITLNRLAHRLREQRFKNGAIGFDRVEVRFEIDDKGKPLSVYFKQAKDANKLVEEFMLLANRTVAESVGKVRPGKKAKVLPYRIHDTPDPNKLENLSTFVSRFGLRLKTVGSKKEVAQSLNKLLNDVKGQKMQELVENVSLRAMMKARYSTFNIGHYGLAFDFYTHFTSPIRRYPDLMVHRLLTRYAEGGKSASQQKYEDLCEHSSEMELLASSAERASIKYKQVEFLSDKIGEEFDATISGVTEFGIYAEINENKCEGLIGVRFLGDEVFDFDDRNFCLVGRKTHRRFSLGDPVRIKVVKANLYKKQLDFDLVKALNDNTPAAINNKIVMGEKKGKKKSKK